MTPFETPIYVTRPNLPPIGELVSGIEEIWASQWLTNRGPKLVRFEQELGAFFGGAPVSVVANGALALELGLKALKLTGEVITTAFTFTASINALIRNGLTPVFADIEPAHLTLDPARVEALITPRTSAILAVHVFGYPCLHAQLAALAARYGLKLIYDAAHAFGTTIGGQPLAPLGDLTMFSFHATKPFHTFEGGALVFRQPALKGMIETLANHGLDADNDVAVPGTNAKMNEIQALMGLLMLKPMPGLIAAARAVAGVYRERLSGIPGIALLPQGDPGVLVNHAFAPILIDETRAGLTRDALHARLLQYNVVARKYFYPTICDMSAFRHLVGADPLLQTRRAARQILSLPIYATLPLDDARRICDMIVAIRAEVHTPSGE